MQLLLDESDFGVPDRLRFIAKFLEATADAQQPPHAAPEPSINGPALPIVLTPYGAPAAPIDPPAAERFLNMEFTFMDPDPAVAFGKQVPAGTSVNPPLPTVSSAVTAPATVESAAPAAASAQTIPNTAVEAIVASDRDSAGLPWDARIHSDTRKTNGDGTWRYRRNLDPALKAQVLAELKGISGPLAPPAPSVAAPAAPIPPVPPSVVPAPAGSTPTPPVPLPPVPLPTIVPVGVPDAPQPAMVPAANFRELMTKISRAIAAGKLTQLNITDMCRSAGVDSITSLAAQPALVPVIDGLLHQTIGIV